MLHRRDPRLCARDGDGHGDRRGRGRRSRRIARPRRSGESTLAQATADGRGHGGSAGLTLRRRRGVVSEWRDARPVGRHRAGFGSSDPCSRRAIGRWAAQGGRGTRSRFRGGDRADHGEVGWARGWRGEGARPGGFANLGNELFEATGFREQEGSRRGGGRTTNVWGTFEGQRRTRSRLCLNDGVTNVRRSISCPEDIERRRCGERW